MSGLGGKQQYCYQMEAQRQVKHLAGVPWHFGIQENDLENGNHGRKDIASNERKKNCGKEEEKNPNRPCQSCLRKTDKHRSWS